MKDTLNNLKFVWKYGKKYKKLFLRYIITSLLSIVISIVTPILSAKIIVYLTNSEFLQLCLIALVIFFVEISRNFVRLIAGNSYQKFFRNTLIELQTSLSREILKLKNKTLDANGTGVFVQRVTNDSSRVSESILFFCDIISECLTNLGIFVAILLISYQAFIFTILSVLVLFFIDKKRVKTCSELDKASRKCQEKTTGFIGETIRGARDVKMLNAEDNFMKKMKELILNVNQSKYEYFNTRRKFNFISGSTRDTIDLFLIVLLVFLIKHEGLSIAYALVVHNYMSRVKGFSVSIENMMNYAQDLNLSAQRIRAIMDGDEFEKESFGTKHLKKVNGNIEFKDVTFSYGSNEVLKNINFKVNANETVAFVGKSGVGKSTIFSLVCKMYDEYNGDILIDGNDIKTLDKDSIRGNITIISQDPYIYNLSIKDNLKLVKKNLTNDEMVKACKMACLDKFIEGLPDKYDTVVGEGGVTLSGGQKQRLAIARAFVQKTEIILFDEATSALDNETQREIAKAINNLQKEYTILIIAHRLSTIKNADRILFIEDGKVSMEGSHKYLLKNCKAYKELYEAEIEK